MGRDRHTVMFDCLVLILKPVVRFCLNSSLGLQDTYEALKVAFLKVAAEDLESQGEKVTISRLNAVTGVDRRVAVRILKEKEVKESATQYATRVIGRWRRDQRYLTKSGRPRVLEFKGDDSEFHTLVRSISQSLHPASVLFDLKRVGAVTETPSGLKLTAQAYIPKGNMLENFEILAEDTESLILAVMDNIQHEGEELPNYHAAVVYNNIDSDDVPKIRQWFYDQCSKFLLKIDKHLSKYDQDINPIDGKDGGHSVTLGLFTKT